MAREAQDFIAAARTGTGKGAARQARREGNVPAIVYGDGKEPVALNISYNYLLKRLKQKDLELVWRMYLLNQKKL